MKQSNGYHSTYDNSVPARLAASVQPTGDRQKPSINKFCRECPFTDGSHSMYERFTDATRRSMVNANREAERHGHDYIGSLHILIAILDADSSVFDAPWINVTHLRETAAEIVSTSPCSGARQAIENALALAVKHKSGVVDIPHIVLGTLTTPDECVTLLLDRTNLNIEQVRTHILEQLTQP